MNPIIHVSHPLRYSTRDSRQVLLTVTQKIICEVIPKFYFGGIHPHAPRTSHAQQCTSETWKWSKNFLWFYKIWYNEIASLSDVKNAMKRNVSLLSILHMFQRKNNFVLLYLIVTEPALA